MRPQGWPRKSRRSAQRSRTRRLRFRAEAAPRSTLPPASTALSGARRSPAPPGTLTQKKLSSRARCSCSRFFCGGRFRELRAGADSASERTDATANFASDPKLAYAGWCRNAGRASRKRDAECFGQWHHGKRSARRPDALAYRFFWCGAGARRRARIHFAGCERDTGRRGCERHYERENHVSNLLSVARLKSYSSPAGQSFGIFVMSQLGLKIANLGVRITDPSLAFYQVNGYKTLTRIAAVVG